MVTLGFRIPKSVLRGHRKIDDLIEYAGPVLSLYRDEEGNPFLRYWATHDEQENRWLIVPVSYPQINAYLSHKISLRDVLLSPEGGAVMLVDTDEEQNATRLTLIETSQIPSEYLPRANSYYSFGYRSYSRFSSTSHVPISVKYPELSETMSVEQGGNLIYAPTTEPILA